MTTPAASPRSWPSTSFAIRASFGEDEAGTARAVKAHRATERASLASDEGPRFDRIAEKCWRKLLAKSGNMCYNLPNRRIDSPDLLGGVRPDEIVAFVTQCDRGGDFLIYIDHNPLKRLDSEK